MHMLLHKNKQQCLFVSYVGHLLVNAWSKDSEIWWFIYSNDTADINQEKEWIRSVLLQLKQGNLLAFWLETEWLHIKL